MLARWELTWRIAHYNVTRGWRPTRRRCTQGDRIYVNRDGVERCLNQLMEKMLEDAGGEMVLALTGWKIQVKE